MHQLRREDLGQILEEPKNALVKQYQRFFGYDDIELVFTEDALWEIADKALERETGARGLRSIIEDALLDVMFELPSRTDVSKCVITKETIAQGHPPDARHERRAAGGEPGRGRSTDVPSRSWAIRTHWAGDPRNSGAGKSARSSTRSMLRASSPAPRRAARPARRGREACG